MSLVRWTCGSDEIPHIVQCAHCDKHFFVVGVDESSRVDDRGHREPSSLVIDVHGEEFLEGAGCGCGWMDAGEGEWMMANGWGAAWLAQFEKHT